MSGPLGGRFQHHGGMSGSPRGLKNVLSLEVAGFGSVSLAVQIRLAASEVPVLLVHGFASNAQSNWAATGWLTDLQRAGMTTITVDLRGHGKSAKPHERRRYSLPILLADLANVLAALPPHLDSLPALDLIGYSMGGRLAAELAAAASGSLDGSKSLSRPSGLPDVRRLVIGGYDGRALFAGVNADDVTQALAGNPGPDSAGRRIARFALAVRGNDLSALSAFVGGMAERPTSISAATIGVPSLVVVGERDEIADAAMPWAAGLPLGRRLVLPGRNHVSAVTSAVFRSAAVEFLTS